MLWCSRAGRFGTPGGRSPWTGCSCGRVAPASPRYAACSCTRRGAAISLRTSSLSFSWVASEPILDSVSLDLAPGWTGLVGANGAGKTTLLRLLAGELVPTAGSVTCPGPALLCPQRVESITADIERFAWGWAGQAPWEWQARLDLEPAMIERWTTLSPGERKRWQIGAALCVAPAVLLLDEPTNHLDGVARELLVRALARYDGVGVVVSHDRALLDALTTCTIDVAGGAVTRFPGPYSEARAAWRTEAEALARRVEALDAEARKARRHLHAARDEQAGAERSRSAGRRMKSAKDSDARSVGAQIRADSAAGKASTRVARARDGVARAEEARAAVERRDELGGAIAWAGGTGRRGRLIELRARPLRAGDHTVLNEVDVVVNRGDRVWIAGPNGAGKSTLLAALRDACRLESERVLFLPQELTAEAGAALLESVRDLPPDVRGRVFQRVAALGVAPARLRESACPSPGEARKLALADALGREVELLLLDEPTNHLDLPSVERLQAALAAWGGALVVVTHDVALGEAVTSVKWSLQGGRIDDSAQVS